MIRAAVENIFYLKKYTLWENEFHVSQPGLEDFPKHRRSVFLKTLKIAPEYEQQPNLDLHLALISKKWICSTLQDDCIIRGHKNLQGKSNTRSRQVKGMQ